MKRKKKSTLDRLYSYDKRNNAYKIEISLDKYEDIYNEWDPTPFKKRDIEEEFIKYVIDSSVDIPMRYNLDLELYLPESMYDEKKEKNAKIEKMMASIDERENGILVYLSHGATLGEAWEIQDVIKRTGLKIPEQMGNAVIYVTK